MWSRCSSWCLSVSMWTSPCVVVTRCRTTVKTPSWTWWPPPPVVNGQSAAKGETGGSTQDFRSGALGLDQSGKSGHPLASDRLNGPSDPSEQRASTASSGSSQPDLVTVPLVKGPKGFGFAIADSPTGQKVKMILDSQWCPGLRKGDIIKEIYHQNVQSLTHLQVVEVLKQFPVGAEVPLLILRGGEWTQRREEASVLTHFCLLLVLPHRSERLCPAGPAGWWWAFLEGSVGFHKQYL